MNGVCKGQGGRKWGVVDSSSSRYMKTGHRRGSWLRGRLGAGGEADSVALGVSLAWLLSRMKSRIPGWEHWLHQPQGAVLLEPQPVFPVPGRI